MKKEENSSRICLPCGNKKLRSGRTLLTLKITDYTDSIMIKMFSRDKEDIPMLQSLKRNVGEGSWFCPK